ncbi:IclR family transcriptional regulator [Hoeflea alexandrii]|uniref:Helix-turn-helix domain-containing protein n=1 Tax=Hoeflea alexandrii TaxID=288436 RepID=A0ABT1CL75_9HYPH|nr:helix-turn-helix domain-containing protein [Hoeflea alexandrii]MCO6406959.1 helix-turn-helix domain-containing protein [Hoeflea alexandrii]MCY0154590.1 helix-turn-helix domain-containing protein [Hoeflea alexandrii]
MSTLQTLSRGLQVLEIVSRSSTGLSIAEIAQVLGVHRAIAYRLASTLEEHLLVVRDDEGRIGIGGGVVALSERYQPQLRAAAQPVLRSLAEASGGTAFLCIAQGDECVAIEVAEPETPFLKVSYRVGSRHPVSRGAAGLAIAMQRAPRRTDTEYLQAARRDGFALTHGQLQQGAIGVAAPLARTGRTGLSAEACIGVVALHALDTEQAASAVLQHRDRLLAALS